MIALTHRIPVTDALRNEILKIKGDEDWRVFDADWWPASHTLAWKIANGKSETTTPEIYHAVGLKPPAILHVVLGAGSSVFGKVGLLDEDLASNIKILVLESQDFEGFEMRQCPVCEAEFLARVWETTKYCHAHNSRSAWYRSGEGVRWRKKHL